LAYHHERIADQLNVIQAQGLGQFERADQGQPFGVAARAKSQIIEYVLNTSDHHGGLHTAGVGTAATVKEYLHPAKRHGDFFPHQRAYKRMDAFGAATSA
jgi:hypothetical protein